MDDVFFTVMKKFDDLIINLFLWRHHHFYDLHHLKILTFNQANQAQIWFRGRFWGSQVLTKIGIIPLILVVSIDGHHGNRETLYT